MLEDDACVRGAEGLGALDVRALAHDLHLRADQPCHERPVDQPDDQDDVAEAAAPDRRDHDHQHEVGNHEEVVGEAHQRVVDLAAEVPRNDADGAADKHRNHGASEADDQRDARAVDEERQHVDAAVVEAEWVCARWRTEERPDLLTLAVRCEVRAEDRDEDEREQDDGADNGLRVVAQERQRGTRARRRADHVG